MKRVLKRLSKNKNHLGAGGNEVPKGLKCKTESGRTNGGMMEGWVFEKGGKGAPEDTSVFSKQSSHSYRWMSDRKRGRGGNMMYQLCIIDRKKMRETDLSSGGGEPRGMLTGLERSKAKGERGGGSKGRDRRGQGLWASRVQRRSNECGGGGR